MPPDVAVKPAAAPPPLCPLLLFLAVFRESRAGTDTDQCIAAWCSLVVLLRVTFFSFIIYEIQSKCQLNAFLTLYIYIHVGHFTLIYSSNMADYLKKCRYTWILFEFQEILFGFVFKSFFVIGTEHLNKKFNLNCVCRDTSNHKGLR